MNHIFKFRAKNPFAANGQGIPLMPKAVKALIVGVALGFAFLGFEADAKDLASRLGVGYADQFGMSRELPSIALRYYPQADIGVSAQLGIDTQKDNSRFGFLAKVFRVVFMEENMNFYIGGAGGLLSEELSGRNESGFLLNGFFGAEFFLPGLDSLGFSFEAGVGVTSLGSGVAFRTVGDHPLRAGITFYF